MNKLLLKKAIGNLLLLAIITIGALALVVSLQKQANANGIQQIVLMTDDPNNPNEQARPTLFVASPQHNSTVTSNTVNYSARFSWINCGNVPTHASLKVYEKISGGKVASVDNEGDWRLLNQKSIDRRVTCHGCDERANTVIELNGTYTLPSLVPGGSTTLWTVADSRGSWHQALIYDFTHLNMPIVPTPTPTATPTPTPTATPTPTPTATPTPTPTPTSTPTPTPTPTTTVVTEQKIVVVVEETKKDNKNNIEFSKTDNRETIKQGETATYKITVKNNRDNDITDAKIVDRLPSYLIPISANPSASANSTSRTITWNHQTISANSEITFAIKVKVASDAPNGYLLQNVATINGDGISANAVDTTLIEGIVPRVAGATITAPQPVPVSAKTGLPFDTISLLLSFSGSAATAGTLITKKIIG